MAPKNLRVHLEAGVAARGLFESSLLLEQEHAETVEAGVAQGLSVLGHVGAEAARAAGAGGDEEVAVDDVVLRHAPLVPHVLQDLHQVADGEVGGVALAAVAKLLAHGEGGVVGGVDGLDFVPDAAQRRGDEHVVGHGQAAHQDRGMAR